MLKLCYVCGARVSAREYAKHKQRHDNESKPRQPTAAWSRTRRQVRKRDKDTCQKCGRTKDQLDQLDLQLHVHHIDGNSDHDAMSNLELRCEDCHPRGGTQRYLP